ncbi:hypothetical protein ACFLZZ_03675 [Nanoarchaeota archaeon]
MKDEMLGDRKKRGLFKKAKQRSAEVNKEVEDEEKKNSLRKPDQEATPAVQDLPDPQEGTNESHKIYSGKGYLNTLSKVFSDFHFPYSARDIIYKKTQAMTCTDEEIIEKWLGNWSALWKPGGTFSTSDAIILKKGKTPTEDMLKIVPRCFDGDTVDSVLAQTITGLVNRSISIDPKFYNKFAGPEFYMKDLILNRDLTKEEAKNHPVWKALTNDQKILDLYVDLVFKKLKDHCEEDKGMRIDLEHCQAMRYRDHDTPLLRHVQLGAILNTPWMDTKETIIAGYRNKEMNDMMKRDGLEEKMKQNTKDIMGVLEKYI